MIVGLSSGHSTALKCFTIKGPPLDPSLTELETCYMASLLARTSDGPLDCLESAICRKLIRESESSETELMGPTRFNHYLLDSIGYIERQRQCRPFISHTQAEWEPMTAR